MSSLPSLSRRAVVGGAAALSALSASAASAATNLGDGELIALGQELEATSAALNLAGDHEEAMALLGRTEQLSAAIVVTPAKTFRGLYVKARATAWALESDCGLLDPTKESTINDRVAASIIRDLLNIGACAS